MVTLDTKARESVSNESMPIDVLVSFSAFDILTMYVGRRVQATAAELNSLRSKMYLQPKSQSDMDALYSPISDVGGNTEAYMIVWQLLATASRNEQGVALNAEPHTLNRISKQVLPYLIQSEEHFLRRTEFRPMNIPNLDSRPLEERLNAPQALRTEDWIKYLSIARQEIHGYRALLSSVQEALARPKQTLDGALQLA